MGWEWWVAVNWMSIWGMEEGTGMKGVKSSTFDTIKAYRCVEGTGRLLMAFKRLFHRDRSRREALVAAYVVPEASRCVQCGICSFNCPIGLDVRRHAWLGESVKDSHCITCGECIARCPRGVLRFERTGLFRPNEET